ncbi:UdgX family uracil-DNA binding protein [Rhodoblastus acidophilus]|uniref:Type-4 uracil-DNA glycosylase n=2 Tax=Rhodoblastus acidophilus TaxID=1074 RepID=A0A6N8DLD0_RHOAC|nr:DNA polymerase [Rhodoblastus acidophilus]MTV29991.1 UdgX family uracil-DNA binding protein [Rhodoblastus acidophilus]
MRMIALERPDDPEAFFEHAAALLAEGIAPEHVSWSGGESADLFAAATRAPRAKWRGEKLFAAALLHRAENRFSLVYRALWRAARAKGWLGNPADPDLCALRKLEGEVRRDSHKMRALVRFREIRDAEGERFIAWYEPSHFTLRANADFFAHRFANMRWSIVTPDLSAHYDGEVRFAPGGSRRDVPAEDARDEDWRTYYAAIFNPARLNLAAMQSHLPKKFWRNLPEARVIPTLARAAQNRAEAMIAAPPTAPRFSRASAPQTEAAATDLADLRAQLACCEKCPLHREATQVVCGAGPLNAQLMIVAEQPGDHEDLAGSPLIGPAGKIFDEALRRTGCDREKIYVTNAVKHFKFTLKGKRRIHAKPGAGEIDACSSWLHREIEIVRPKVIVAMGATALRGLTGQILAVRESRGKMFDLAEDRRLLTTTHPAYLLRLQDEQEKRLAWRAFLSDLAQAHAMAQA